MSPEEPGAPDDARRDTGATFGSGAEQADRPPPTAGGQRPPEPGPPRPVDAPSATPKVVAPTTRRRFLDDPDPDAPKAPRVQRVRLRKKDRIIRHVEPWSVLKISVLFFASIFLIICIASAVLWNAARSAGAIDDVESFITSLGFGNCEDIEPTETTPEEETPSTVDASQPQVGGDSTTTSSSVPEPEDERSSIPDEDGECAEGQRLVGGFKFEDERIFQSFALFGIVLVLSGAATSVVMALLFNLISDLTGGVRVTVLEEEPTRRRSGSPPPASDG